MRIAGLQKLTLLDFPGKTAATVFTPGCNFRCPFCHNADLVTGEAGRDGAAADSSALSIDELFAFLGKRQGLLDGVCITGGEPLLQSGIDEFCTRVHELGFAVKLDTNGSFPGRLRALVEEGLVDYVATDVKNAPERYAETVGVPAFDLAPVQESLDFLRSGAVPYEVRTTVVRRPARAGCVDRRRTSVAPAKLHRRGQRAGRRRSLPRMGPRRPAGTAARAAGRRAGRSAARGGLEPRGAAPSHAASTRLLRIPNSGQSRNPRHTNRSTPRETRQRIGNGKFRQESTRFCHRESPRLSAFPRPAP